MELTCHVYVAGEQKSVTFPMDLSADTPEAVAAEMVEELGMENNDETISDIVQQINAFMQASAAAMAEQPRLALPPTVVEEAPSDGAAGGFAPPAAVPAVPAPVAESQHLAADTAALPPPLVPLPLWPLLSLQQPCKEQVRRICGGCTAAS